VAEASCLRGRIGMKKLKRKQEAGIEGDEEAG
jgi:hypothetical protein